MLVNRRKVDNKIIWSAEADSLDDLVHWLNTTPETWRRVQSSHKQPSHEWDFNTDWKQTLQLARYGWDKGVRDVAARLAVSMPALESEPKWRYDVAGERPDIGRFLSGDPANMMRHGHPKGRKPVVHLVVPICVSAMVNASEMVNYGAAMVAVIDKLENSGRRVQVTAGWANDIHHGERVAGTWTVKRAEDALDLSAVVFSVGHPAASRRLGFAIVERSPFRETSSYGHGRSRFDLFAEDFVEPSAGAVYMPALSHGSCRTMSAALNYLAETINKAASEGLVQVEE